MATRPTGRIAQITNGPSKFDLMVALFDRNDCTGSRKEVNFCAGEERVWEVRITSVTESPEHVGCWEQGEDWIIEGVIMRDFDPMSLESIKQAKTAPPGKTRRFRSSFSTRTRKGTFVELEIIVA